MQASENLELLQHTTTMLIKHAQLQNEQHETVLEQKNAWVQEYERLADQLKAQSTSGQTYVHQGQNSAQRNFRSIKEGIPLLPNNKLDIMYLETEYERQLSFKRMIRKKVLENEALDAKLERIDAHTAKKLGLLEKIQQHSNDFDANLLNLTDTMMVGLKSFNESITLIRQDPLHQSADGQVRFYPRIKSRPATYPQHF